MLRTKTYLIIGIALATVSVWGLLGWRLLVVGGLIPGTTSSSWHDLARRSAWAHWVNGSPTIRDGRAVVQRDQQFEIAVQPITVCLYLHFSIETNGALELTAKDTGAHQRPEIGFTTQGMPRAFDGYHFLLTAKNDQVITSFTFSCRP